MSARYSLTRVLKEIDEDEQINRTKHQQLSQAEIRDLFARRSERREQMGGRQKEQRLPDSDR